jgi:hypothetical protein
MGELPGAPDAPRTLRLIWETDVSSSEGMRPSHISPHKTRVDMGHPATMRPEGTPNVTGDLGAWDYH